MMTLVEIARVMGVGVATVARAEQSGLRKLRLAFGVQSRSTVAELFERRQPGKQRRGRWRRGA
jgi:hypothetical protein